MNEEWEILTEADVAPFLDLPGSEYLVPENSQRKVFNRFGRLAGFHPPLLGPSFPGCRCSSIALFPTCGHSLPPLPFNLHVPLLMQSGYYVPRADSMHRRPSPRLPDSYCSPAARARNG